MYKQLLFLLLASPLLGLPQGAVPTHGETRFQLSAQSLEILASDRSILEWPHFSIEEGETVRFIQPHSQASVLNRVMDPSPSRIMGNLESNGQVILINPNGILVGKEARIDTGSLIASCFDVQNELYFNAEEMVFSGPSLASVVNEGLIQTKEGEALFMGARVENHGSINTQNGMVGLFAQGDVILKPSGSDRILIRARTFNDSENIFAQAFIPDDQLSEIGYAAHSGSIVSDWVGIFGGMVDVRSGAKIDASSPDGGGTVLIGGDYQGKSSAFPNAWIANVSQDAEIHADATSSGNGGKIIVWGDRISQMAGSLSAQGGPLGGNGGFLEISSPGALFFLGDVNTLAPQGHPGTLLLDPVDITISAAATTAGILPAPPYTPCGVVVCPVVFNFGAIAAPNINTTNLQSALGCCNVTINTNNSTLAGNGDITISSPLSFATGVNTLLTFISNRDININSAMSFGVASSQNVRFEAGRNIRIGAALTNSSGVANSGTFTFIATGSITQNSPVTYSVSAVSADLTYIANNGITINASSNTIAARPGITRLTDTSAVGISIASQLTRTNVNNGCVILEENGVGPVTLIGHAGATAGVGAIATLTRVNAPNADLNINALAITGVAAQLGYNPGPGSTAVITSPIEVCCNNLNLNGGGGPVAFNNASIGHGVQGINGNGSSSTTAQANITIHAAGNINLNGGPTGSSQFARIGHGCVANQVATANQLGNITVTAGGNISLNGGTGGGAHAWIGHGGDSNTVAAAAVTLQGNIIVSAGGNISVTSNVAAVSPSAGQARIGHFQRNGVTNLIGDIDVAAGQNLFVTNNRLGNTAFIGHYSQGSVSGILGVIQGNYRIRATTDLTMGTGAAAGADAFIGYKRPGLSVTADPPFIGQLDVVVGRNLTLSSFGIESTNAPITLGIFLVNGALQVPAGTTANVLIGVGNNLVINNNNPRTPISIESPTDLFVSVGNNIVGSNTPGFIASIGTTNNIAGTTFIRCAGNIDARSIRLGTGLGLFAFVPFSFPFVIPPQMRSLNVRAAGDLVMGVNFTTVTGTILVEADSPFDEGDLWNSGGGFLNSIAGGAVTAFPLNLNIPACVPTPCAGGMPCIACCGGNPTCVLCCGADTVQQIAAPFLVSSTAIAANEIGGFSVNTAVSTGLFGGATTAVTQPNFVTLQTTSGNLSVHSADLQSNNTAQNLTIGTAANQLRIITTSGNLQISGSVATDSFHNIVLSNVANPWTSGSIYVSANNNLSALTVPIVTSGASSLSLIADQDGEGTGDLALAVNITSSGGDILLQAGIGVGCSTAFHTSSITQTAGTISTTGAGNLTLNADFDLNLRSLVNCASGNLHSLAGHETNLTNATLTKTAGGGDLLMISGLDMNMINSHIVAVPSFVTLVVDNCFPTSPLIGPGAFNMDATSSIDPVNLRIFTALQNLNSIQGVLNLNGSTFVAGTPFTNTATEHWCQYFSFPFPYPQSNLGQPFTIFYKDCLQQITYQAQVVVTQFLLDLHPYNEYPGWMQRFWIEYSPKQKNTSSSLTILSNEPFYLRRRHLNIINNPKTWTVWME